MRIDRGEAAEIRDDVRIALEEARRHGIGNSKVDFAAVGIARAARPRHVGRLEHGEERGGGDRGPRPRRRWCEPRSPRCGRRSTGAATTSGRSACGATASFMQLVGRKGFSPVKISWEDIGRHAGSVWGDRISDVGIWVRQDEADPGSARLALSVRRDGNFRDKVLVVPASAIKVHQRVGRRTVEKTLPERLAELGDRERGARPERDRLEPVRDRAGARARSMRGAWADGVPPRAAFTFSIFPYGSTNLVITDVIEGSHEAIVGPGQHQLLYANVDGEQGAVHGEPRRGPARPPAPRARAARAGHGRRRAALLPHPGPAAPRRARRPPVEHGHAADGAARSSSRSTSATRPARPATSRPRRRPACRAGSSAASWAASSAARRRQSAPAPSAKAEQRSAAREAEADRGLVRVAIGHGETRGRVLGRQRPARRARRGADPRHGRLLRDAGRRGHAARHAGLRRRLRPLGLAGDLGRQLRDEGHGLVVLRLLPIRSEDREEARRRDAVALGAQAATTSRALRLRRRAALAGSRRARS